MSIHVNHCLTTVIACGDCLLHVVCMSIGAIDLSACIQMLPLACSCSRLHAVTPARMQLYPRAVACMQLDGAVHAGRGPRHSVPPSNPFSHASNLDFRHRTTMSWCPGEDLELRSSSGRRINILIIYFLLWGSW